MGKGIFDDEFAVNESPTEGGHDSAMANDGPTEGHPSQAEQVVQGTPVADAQPEKLYAGKYKTVEDMERAYQEAQSTMTQRAQEAATYRRQVEEYNQYLYALAAQMQQQQAQAAQAQQAQTQAPAMPEKTPEEWATDLYSDPVGTVGKIAEQRAQQLVEERMQEFYAQKIPELGQVLEQAIGPLQRQAQFQALQQQKSAEVASLRSKYKDFNNLRDDIAAIIDRNPQLAQLPGGIEHAYKEARYNRWMAQNQSQQMVAQKQAAGMAGSVRVPQKAPDPTEQLKQGIFGPTGAGGVFG